jgi:hypothetical protein
MVNLLALSPVLALLLGALAILPPRRSTRFRLFISVAAVLAALVLLLVNGRQSEIAPFLFPAASSAPDLDLTLNFSPGALFFSAVTLIGFLGLGLIEASRAETRVGAGALVTLSGAVAFYCAANWPTLAAAWLLVDLGFLLWRLSDSNEPNWRSLPWRGLGFSQFGALIFLAAGVLVLNSGSSLRFENGALGGLSADLVVLAAWIRTGLYPFKSLPPSKTSAGRPDRLERVALTAMLGSYLLIRALIMLQGEFAFASLLYSLALLGVGATALLVLTEGGTGQDLASVAQAIAAPMLLTPFLAVLGPSPAIVVWLALGLFDFVVIATCARLLRTGNRRQPWRQVLWGVAILAAAGFPLTPGFFGRIGLYAAASQSGGVLLAAAIAASTTLALVPLWRGFLEARGEQQRNPTWIEYAGLAALLLPLFFEGLAPFVVTSFFGRGVEDASTFAYDALLRAPNASSPLLLLGAVILPLPLAFLLARARGPLLPLIGDAPRMIARVLDLSWLGRGIVWALDSLGMAARQVTALIEQHPIGWILFAAIWVALWLMNAQGGR